MLLVLASTLRQLFSFYVCNYRLISSSSKNQTNQQAYIPTPSQAHGGDTQATQGDTQVRTQGRHGGDTGDMQVTRGDTQVTRGDTRVTRSEALAALAATPTSS